MVRASKQVTAYNLLAALVCLPAMGNPGKALAEPRVAKANPVLPALGGVCEGTTAQRLIVKGTSSLFVLPIHSTMWTVIKVPSGIDRSALPDIPGFEIKPRTNTRFWIAPRPDTPPDSTATIKFSSKSLVTGTSYQATIVVKVAESGIGVPDVAEIVHESEDRAAREADTRRRAEVRARRQAEITLAHDQGKAEGIAIGRAEGQAQAERQMLAAAIRAMDDHERNLIPNTPRMIRSDRGLGARYVRARVFSERYTLITVEVENLDVANQPFRLTQAQVFAQKDQPRESRLILPDSPKTIYGGDLVSIAIAVEMQPGDQLSDIRVALSEEDGSGPTFPFEGTWEATTKEAMERRRWGQQTVVSVHGLFGAFWFADGEGNDDLAATTFAGVGVRFTKGLHENLAFEVDLAGGTTGQASFEDIATAEGPADLKRSGVLGRLLARGIVRFGHKVNPMFRLGVGIQGGSIQTEMTNGAGGMSERDSSFEFNTFLSMGGGVSFRVGENFVAGLAGTVETPMGMGTAGGFGPSLSAEANLGYAW